MTNSYVVIDKRQLDLYKDMIVFTPDEVALLSDYRGLFVKLIDAKIIDIRVGLANLQYNGSETSAVLSISLLQELKKTLDGIIDTYKSYLEQEKEKERE